ncbi:hypothetical protein [Sulfuracidifex tepidarius]|uniref:hypothetical protein n=1 Tax=Sulfuracidifex tepidarius TaxID=1294262 RepID=UPI0006D0FE1D|nr:hypothetical protein [Sulfuracidifex tepidarius]
MKAIIKYDNGETEEVELEKKEVIPSDQGNVAHFKYVKLDKSKSIVIHVYLPTTEEPNVRAIDIGKEVVERKTSISRYNNIADDLITRAKFMSPSVDKCVFCGDLASNTFKGKKFVPLVLRS